MTPKHQHAVSDSLLLADSAAELRRELEEKESMYRATASDLLAGMSVAEALTTSRVDVARRELSDALERFETLRHRSRLSLTAAGIEEGMSIGQIGRSWGISRQLASRYAAEVNEDRSD